MPSTWTEEQLIELRQRYDNSETFSQIALAMGISRNSAISKAHRMKFPQRGVQLNGARAAKAAKAKLPKPPQPAKPAKPAVELKELREALHTTPPRLVPEPLRDNLVELEALERGQCKWPFGDPRQPGFGFCGEPAVPDKPYCPEHQNQAHSAHAIAEHGTWGTSRRY